MKVPSVLIASRTGKYALTPKGRKNPDLRTIASRVSKRKIGNYTRVLMAVAGVTTKMHKEDRT